MKTRISSTRAAGKGLILTLAMLAVMSLFLTSLSATPAKASSTFGYLGGYWKYTPSLLRLSYNTGFLSPELAGYVDQAAGGWNQSPTAVYFSKINTLPAQIAFLTVTQPLKDRPEAVAWTEHLDAAGHACQSCAYGRVIIFLYTPALDNYGNQDPYWRSQLYKAVIAHELGHALGLDHVNDNTALMSPNPQFNANGTGYITTPQAGEIAGINGLYPQHVFG